jgi:hypothetical protein
MAEPNLTEIIASTLRERQGSAADNVTNKNALLSRLSERGKVDVHSGGRTIVRELDYAENSTFKYYTGYELLDTNASLTLDAAEYDWKQAAVVITISGEDKRKNSGENGIIRLMDHRMTNAMRTLSNNLSTGLYSDGTGSGGLQVGGLQSIVADDPTTGTVGGINAASFTFWRNIAFDATTDGGAAASASNILSYMNTVYNQTTRGNEAPDLIPADLNYFGFFEDSQQANQRFADSKMAEAGFQVYKYKGADVVLDNDSGISTNHMYFLNTEFLFWDVHEAANMTPLEGRAPVNQDADVVPVIWMGNLTCSNRERQGVLKD